ncbi:MAG: helix-turn-helix domain-containing protein [Zoogloeaceae bacterium]|jgi:excisionase family DNA binding protein|nr:helix-turn-helix domain-containing protein [Zoogloeaceae bacterium]
MPTNDNKSGILTLKEIAGRLKVAERAIHRLAAARKIPAFKVGGTWRFRMADMGRWIAAQSKKPEAK